MIERGFGHQVRSRLIFGFGLSLGLACQSTPLSGSLPPTDAPSGAGVPCPASRTRCGAVCADEATDPQNCGGCGLACDQCTNGRCIRVLASGQPHPDALAVTSSEVVWANTGVATDDYKLQGAAILKVPIGGGAPETLAQSDTDSWSLAIDSGYVYWARSNTRADMSTDGAIMKTPMTGGATTTLASASWPNDVGVSGGVVYWTDERGVMSVPASGGSAVVFAPGGGALTLAAGHAYWLAGDADTQSFRTRELAPGADEVTLLTWKPFQASGPWGTVFKLAASTSDLYWTASAGGTNGSWLMKVSLSGGTPSPIDNADTDIAVTTDADSVYWANQYWAEQGVSSAGITSMQLRFRILKAPLAGGPPITLAPSVGEVHSLVVDGTSVYFSDPSGGTVVKVTPK
jgi:hypothetical protein